LVSKRVMIVLAALVATLTVSSGLLLVMDSAPLGATPPTAFVASPIRMHELVAPRNALQTAAWRYIIVYESGDLEASAASLADGRAKGVGTKPVAARPPANFHFVVDAAGSRGGALDGELEVASSWQRQEVGTPFAGWPDNSYHSYHPYTKAIGVCVAGDLTQRPYSEAQVRCLVQLVQELQSQLRIDNDAVKFQWELDPTAFHSTPSPTQKVFAEEFRRRLSE